MEGIWTYGSKQPVDVNLGLLATHVNVDANADGKDVIEKRDKAMPPAQTCSVRGDRQRPENVTFFDLPYCHRVDE